MAMEREVLSPGQDQRRFDAQQMCDWVNYLAPWEVIAHLTFRDRILPETWSRGRYLPAVTCGMGLDGARKRFEKFMATHLPRVSYFYAEEQNPSRDGYHVHALWSDCRGVFRKEAWASWFKAYGRARIEPVNNQDDVSGYAAKYVTKDGAWWNLKLQWHRVQAMHNRDFKLREEPC